MIYIKLNKGSNKELIEKAIKMLKNGK